ncbi:MAG: nucleotidyltransferase family protein [Pseudomonadota bacterium]
MRREDILKKLDGQRPELVTAGVKSLALFGSLARDEAIDSSDVDLLVEFARPTGLLGLIALKHALERALEVEKVDLLTPEGLHPALKHRILAEAIRVI